jgi:hypothetical protein
MAEKRGRRPGGGDRPIELRRGGKKVARAEAEAAEEEIIQFDPHAPREREVVGAGATVAQAAETPDTVPVGDDWFSARDEMLQRLTGPRAQAVSQAAISPGERRSKVQGVGIGFKMSGGTLTGDIAVKVFVEEKLPESDLHDDLAVPSALAGMPTDVEEVGSIRAHSYAHPFQRPVPCGASCGHVNITAGTIGCLVVRQNNHLCILSNNHVLADANGGQPGDDIIQPGKVDMPPGHVVGPDDVIATLEEFVPLSTSAVNFVDCAVAFTTFDMVDPRHVTYTLNPNPIGATLGTTVVKNGRTTQSTIGTITDIGFNGVQVGYRIGTCTFNNQIVIRGVGGVFSRPGDSGSLIVTANSKQPVALLFAGTTDNSKTFANPIGAVMQALGIKRFLASNPGG